MAAETQTTPRVLGRYALFNEIASGGMATVHLGRLVGASGFTKTVAIKCLHPQYAKDPDFVTMFIDEARLAARIQHPNVVSTLDVVAIEGALFLVMEYVAGESLARLARTARAGEHPIPPEIAASIVVGALHGLHAAHEAVGVNGEPLNIVHRDVSPQNILVAKDGAARVLDFGVAKASNRGTKTGDGVVKGKLPYMAPEQFYGVTTRMTDIYAASVVLWETLAGRRLFRGATEAETLRMVLEGTTEPPSTHAPGLPKALDEIVLRGLATDPARRYPTARDMARALEKSVPIATASDVAEFVESLAGPLLIERARQVAAIESAELSLIDERVFESESARVAASDSRPPNIITGANRSASAVDIPAGIEPLTQLSTTTDSGSLEPRASTPPGRRRAKRGIAAAVVLALVALTSVLVLTTNSNAPNAAAASASVTDDQAVARAPVSSASASPTAARDPAPGAVLEFEPTTIDSAGARMNPVASAASVRVHRPPRPLGSANKGNAPARDCNPPYTVDAQGFRHYKRECE